jgi:hypothetical protein
VREYAKNVPPNPYVPLGHGKPCLLFKNNFIGIKKDCVLALSLRLPRKRERNLQQQQKTENNTGYSVFSGIIHVNDAPFSAENTPENETRTEFPSK